MHLVCHVGRSTQYTLFVVVVAVAVAIIVVVVEYFTICESLTANRAALPFLCVYFHVSQVAGIDESTTATFHNNANNRNQKKIMLKMNSFFETRVIPVLMNFCVVILLTMIFFVL